MIRINLLADRELEESSSRRRELVLSGGILLLTLGAIAVVYSSQTARLHSLNTQVELLKNATEEVRQHNEEIVKLEQKKKELEDKIRVVRLLTSPQRRAAAVHILDDLSTNTPEFLWLTDFTENTGSAKINGQAIDNQTIASFAHNLSGSRYFKNIEIRETIQEDLIRATPGRTNPRQIAAATPPSVAATRFLIEARIDYLPTEPEEGGDEAGQSGTAGQQ